MENYGFNRSYLLRKALLFFISCHDTYLQLMLDTFLLFQSPKEFLKINISDFFNLGFGVFLQYSRLFSETLLQGFHFLKFEKLEIGFTNFYNVFLFFFFLHLYISIIGFIIELIFIIILGLNFRICLINFIFQLNIFIYIFIQILANFLGVSCL